MLRGTRILPAGVISLCIKIISVYDNDIRQNQWTMKYRSLTHIYFTRLIFESHWSIIPSTTFLHQSLQDMKQNRWTIKYRSLTYIYLIKSIYVSHWSIIPTMIFIHQIILKILSKITRPWNIGHVDIFNLRSNFRSDCLIILKYDSHASNSLGDTRQNHWTMKYRSDRPTFILRSNTVTYIYFEVKPRVGHTDS